MQSQGALRFSQITALCQTRPAWAAASETPSGIAPPENNSGIREFDRQTCNATYNVKSKHECGGAKGGATFAMSQTATDERPRASQMDASCPGRCDCLLPVRHCCPIYSFLDDGRRRPARPGGDDARLRPTLVGRCPGSASAASTIAIRDVTIAECIATLSERRLPPASVDT